MANYGALSFCLSFSCFLLLAQSQSQPDHFIFYRFDDSAESPMILNGASIIKPSGALKLTNRSRGDIGQAFYRRPFQMLAENSASDGSAALSFSTHFVFAIRPPSSGEGGYGLAFVVAPKTSFPGAEAEHYLGLFNSSNDDGNPSNHMLVVEFDTVKGYKETSDSKGNHVGLNLNSMESKAAKPAAYNIDGKSNYEEITLESGKAIQGWIEYDGSKQMLNITISPIDVEKPAIPLLSEPVNLTSIFVDSMYVGFSASTGTKRSFHYILGWSFRLNGTATPLNLTQLPLPPDQTDSSSSSYKPQTVALIASLCGIAVCLLGILSFHTVIKKRRQHENLEDWELDCPHRFRYKDLHQATKGFKQSEVIGIGGFGAVYRGILPANGCEVAVKKVSRNSIQGMREFVAEIESLGRLRHKNLVNLQGWCKQKDELLLVYDYVPNGSLDALIFKRKDRFVLNWEQRFHIIKGIAAGLLYLHEEWEQVVIHRDVKSSNVLIDAEMNARLGDFGLARLYEHGKMSHTTNLVGTIGYIAPELARSGKASTSSDVYAYGILLLEVASGRRPTDSSQFLLMDWVIECYETGRILDAVDPKLGSAYDAEEMEMVLNLGLACSQYHAQARPTMRQVIRYLNQDEPVPAFADDPSSAGSRRADDMSLRLFEVVSSDTIRTSHTTTSSYPSSSGHALSTSLGGGR